MDAVFDSKVAEKLKIELVKFRTGEKIKSGEIKMEDLDE